MSEYGCDNCGLFIGEGHAFYVEQGERKDDRVCHDCFVQLNGMVVYEAPCDKCGKAILTDEWVGSRPYFGTSCECGGHATDTWVISDEPHPSVWGM